MRKLCLVVVVIGVACGGAAKKPRPVTIENRPSAREQAIEAARSAGVLGTIGCGGSTYGGDLYGGGMYGGSTYGCWSAGAFATLTGDVSTGFDDVDIYGGLIGDEAGETGGLATSGLGEGGGGTGWGTLGTGSYGTIGHGSGTGTGTGYGVGGGRGGMRGRSRDAPSVKIGNPKTEGDLDKAIIRRYIRMNIAKIRYCYEKQLLAEPSLEGTVKAQFTIGSDGLVTSSTAKGVHADVASCVAGVIGAIQFPKPKGNGTVHVSYPFTFKPEGG